MSVAAFTALVGVKEAMIKLHVLSGPESSLSFELKEAETYLGRSSENDIQIGDRTISRKHLKITQRGDRLYVADLNSQNGTFVHGKPIKSSWDVEVKQGVPIVLGMSVICLGEGCVDLIQPFLESIEINQAPPRQSGIFLDHRDKTNQKKLAFLYDASSVLMKNLPVIQTCERILDLVLKLLKRVDRAAFILLDPATGHIRQTVFRTSEPSDPDTDRYCKKVVERVIRAKNGLIVTNADSDAEEELAETLKLFRIESVMCLPLICGTRILGVLYIDSRNRPYVFGKEDIPLFTDLTQESALAIEYAMLREDIEKGLEP